MTYELEFSDKAWKEWQKLGATLREQFKKKLEERLVNPHVQADRLTGLGNALGKRERGQVYDEAARR